MRHVTVLLSAVFGLATTVAACGSESAATFGSARGRIIGGQLDATHLAVVAVMLDAGVCTGTIVRTDPVTGVGWVLTAAHCVDGKKAAYVRMVDDYTVGQNDPQPYLRATDFVVSETVRHPGYVALTGTTPPQNDFAVLRILGVDASTPVIPILPANLDDLAIGKSVVEVGYGKISGVVDAGDNSKRRSVTTTLTKVSATELETSYAIGSTCQGDSGGPSLYVSGGKEYVAGVTSYSDSDCKVYAVAERVASALAWIDGEVNKAPALSGCNLCREVSTVGSHACHAAYERCNSDAECAALRDCRSTCSTAACFATCESKHPLAVGPLLAWVNCACLGECKSKCGSVSACGNVPKCSVDVGLTACGKCQEASCCSEVTTAAHEPVGNRCLATKGTFAGCASNAAYKAVEACRASKCAADCGLAPPSSSAPPLAEAPPEGDAGSAPPAPAAAPPAEDSGCAVVGRASSAPTSSASWVAMALLAWARRRRRVP